MAIKRNVLISAINSAYKNKEYNSYEELLSLYYKMLEQEKINNDYIMEFIFYENLSEASKKILLSVNV